MFSNEKTRLLNPLDWAEVALSTPDERQLEAWLEYRSDALGFETMSLSLGLSRRNPAIPARDQIFGSLVSPAWHDYYYRNSHLMRHDPMAKYLFSDETPATFRADTPPPISISTPEEWKFLQHVIDFGMWGTLAFFLLRQGKRHCQHIRRGNLLRQRRIRPYQRKACQPASTGRRVFRGRHTSPKARPGRPERLPVAARTRMPALGLGRQDHQGNRRPAFAHRLHRRFLYRRRQAQVRMHDTHPGLHARDPSRTDRSLKPM